MGSNPSKQRPQGYRPPPAPERGIIRGSGRRGPVTGHPGTYDNIQEQLFTTNNFAPAPRNPHSVNFRETPLVSPAQPARVGNQSPNVKPGPRGPVTNVAQSPPRGVGQFSPARPMAQPRVDVLSPQSTVRHQVNRPPRDWENLRVMSNAPAPYRSSYPRGMPMQEPGMRYARQQPIRIIDGDPYASAPRRHPPRGVPVYSRFPQQAYLPRQRPVQYMPEYQPEYQPSPRGGGEPAMDSPRAIPGYEDAYIPPPPDKKGKGKGKAQPMDDGGGGDPYGQQPMEQYGQQPMEQYGQQPMEPYIQGGNGMVNRDMAPMMAQPREQPRAAPVLERRYVTESSRPMVNGENYEVESLMSEPKATVPKATVEDTRPEKYLSPREIQNVSRSQPTTRKDDDDDYIGANLRFHRNEIRYRPNGEHIDTIHQFWYGDYQRLANTTTYLPWLFPLPKRSRINPFSEPLLEHEAKHIHKDRRSKERYMTSYKMMLDFFGIQLVSEKTGEVKRAPNWKERFHHLKRSRRSHERITRILTSHGQLGFPYLQAPLVLFLLHETLETKELSTIPYPALRDWHRSISNKFDANYVAGQCDKMNKGGNAANKSDGSNKRHRSEDAENVDPENGNLYRFDLPKDSVEARLGGNHKNKDKRLTYRSEIDSHRLPTVNENGNANGFGTSPRQQYTPADTRNPQQTPVNGNYAGTPKYTRNSQRTPNTRNSQRTPGTRNSQRTPDYTRDDQRTPDFTRNGTKTPDNIRNGQNTPDAIRNSPKTPDYTRNERQTPDYTRDDRRTPTPEFTTSDQRSPDRRTSNEAQNQPSTSYDPRTSQYQPSTSNDPRPSQNQPSTSYDPRESQYQPSATQYAANQPSTSYDPQTSYASGHDPPPAYSERDPY